jgi:hypothetical protein
MKLFNLNSVRQFVCIEVINFVAVCVCHLAIQLQGKWNVYLFTYLLWLLNTSLEI